MQPDARKVSPQFETADYAHVSVDSHARFVRALLFGAGGAAIGLALYATVAIVTGLVIGYVSVAVGYIVAKAMMKGSGGTGGRRYQIAAVLLTYAAVSMAAIPVAIAAGVRASPRVLALMGLASPFLELRSPINGIIGLVILFVGLRIAWTATAGRALSIEGPF